MNTPTQPENEEKKPASPPAEWREAISDHRLLRVPEVRFRVGFSYEHIRRLQRAGGFPRAIKLGARTIAWRGSAIREWIESRDAA